MRDLLSTRDIAQMYQVTSATVLNWIRAGKLKAYTTPGGHYRVACADLESFARTYSPPADNQFFGLRVLLVGSDVDYFDRLRSTVRARWPAAQVQRAGNEFEIGWWLARLRPTHVLVHPTLTPKPLLVRFQHLLAEAKEQTLRVSTLPESPGDGLAEWLEHEIDVA